MAAQEVRNADLRVDGVAKRYGAVVALGGVSLSVAAAEFLTILGPSGSGKTTLLEVVAGFSNFVRAATFACLWTQDSRVAWPILVRNFGELLAEVLAGRRRTGPEARA